MKRISFLLFLLVLTLLSLGGCAQDQTICYFTFANEGIDSITLQSHELDAYTPPTPTKEGNRFVGWYLDKELTIPYSKEALEDAGRDVSLYAKWENGPYRITVTSNIKDAIYLNGTKGDLSADMTTDQPIKIAAAPGYRYLYHEIGGTRYESDTISLADLTADTEIKIYAELFTDELPIIHINTNGAEINSKSTYTDMTFSLSNCEGELNEVTGGIRLRGNSTMHYPKKPYRIKFDKKQSLFGLEKAKSWVLLAEYLDPSALHNHAAMSIASQMDGLSFTPTMHKVNVYLNGDYIGLYTLCEQVQENEGRIDIEVDITEQMTALKDFNFFVCMDYNVSIDPEAILGENAFYIEKYNQYFELKYPEKDQFTSEAQFEKFFGELVAYVTRVLDAFTEKDVDWIKSEVNLKSLADYLIVDQVMGERDHASKSFHMYYTSTSDNDEENLKLNFGPVWDYDFSLYTPWTGYPNTYYTINNDVSFSNVFFKTCAEVDELYALVKERYREAGAQALEDYLFTLHDMEMSMRASLAENHALWYSSYPDTMTDDNITFLSKFLLSRKCLLDELWG